MNRFRRALDNSNIMGYAFIMPYLIGLLVFTLVPFLNSFYLSFTQYNILTDPKFIGLDNFKRMFFDDPKFWISLRVTLKFALIQVPVKVAFSLLVAIILNKATKIMPFYRAAFYIPSLLGGSVAVALTWSQLFGNNGAINSIIGVFGIAPVKWLRNPATALYTLIALGVWQFGSSMLIFLAGIKNVPVTYHEAAIVDGAGPVKRFFKITLPMISPVLFFNLINQVIGSLQAFNSSYLITSGGPLNSTLYYGLHLYNRAFGAFEMGYGSAMAWFMLVIIAVLTALIFRSSGGWVYYESEGK